MSAQRLHPDSQAVHAGRDDLTELGVHALPLDFSSTNPLPSIDAGGQSYEVLATGGHPFEGGSNVYARLWNPTVARFETALAQLENAEEAVAFSSGMAAMTAMWGGAPGRYDGIPGSGDSGRMSAWDSGLEEARRRFGGKQ